MFGQIVGDPVCSKGWFQRPASPQPDRGGGGGGGGGCDAVLTCLLTQILDKRRYAILNQKRGRSGGWHTLRQELGILSAINHRNLIRLKRLFEDDDVVYVVTDFLRGGTLLDLLVASDAPLRESQARRVMRQVFAALAYLHDTCNVVHRDIKVLTMSFGPSASVHLWLCVCVCVCVTHGRLRPCCIRRCCLAARKRHGQLSWRTFACQAC